MSNHRLKGLFITHNYGLYGASQSLQLLIRNNDTVDATLIIPWKKFLKRSEREGIARRFGIDSFRIKQFFLPWSNCFEGRKTDLPSKTVIWLKNLFWKINKSSLYHEIQNGHYDFIHLNSLVLNDIINNSYPFIIHIREFLCDYSEKVLGRIKRAKGVVFIDESIKRPFENVKLENEITLSNPVDMRQIYNYCHLQWHYRETPVISVIGRVEQGKGVDFIIRAFKETSASSLRLFVVGDEGDGVSTGYESYCRKIAGQDKRVVFWGFENDIYKVYAISDYIIRGEVDFRMGRSVLEALYTDCDVILPINNENIINTNQELLKFQDKIHPYKPRNIEDLKRLFLSINSRKVVKKKYQSNVEEYIKKYNDFIWRILNRNSEPC